VRLPECPWLIVQGDLDELVDPARVQSWVASITATPDLVVLPGVEHFFHGRMNDLRTAVLDWVRRT
jgi:alpha/beta superfamily hydrolase